MEKKRVNLYLSVEVKDELDRQAERVGMSMSSYFAYLIMKEKEELEEEKLLRALQEEYLKAKVL